MDPDRDRSDGSDGSELSGMGLDAFLSGKISCRLSNFARTTESNTFSDSFSNNPIESTRVTSIEVSKNGKVVAATAYANPLDASISGG